ncbi:hypothetical protein LCGC14_2129680 [marine sediment metagenome]|uniref:Uncharacterized protein n=1 Tax=marine sediment metagenome TaxID=412755 RepID=A0A0F9E1W0_9ZZZZ
MTLKIKRNPAFHRLIGLGLASLAAVTLAAPGALASPFDGKWRPGSDTLCDEDAEPDGWIRIEDDTFEGVKSRCVMASPVNVRDMDAILYDMQCSAEDTEWTDRAMLMRAADGGLIMVWNGFAFKYESCPLPGSAEAEKAAEIAKDSPQEAKEKAAEVAEEGPEAEVD